MLATARSRFDMLATAGRRQRFDLLATACRARAQSAYHHTALRLRTACAALPTPAVQMRWYLGFLLLLMLG